MPDELAHLWQWWLEMRTGEGVTNQEMLAWCQLHQIVLRQWEMDVIRSLERIYRSATNE